MNLKKKNFIFDRFGGKEFYMSFDKMNEFVEEHTILMKEFLRNISTSTEADLLNESVKLNRSVLPIVTLTPQTPNMPHRSMRQQQELTEDESNFEFDFIDLGKQLSILHSLLVTILASLDEVKATDFKTLSLP